MLARLLMRSEAVPTPSSPPIDRYPLTPTQQGMLANALRARGVPIEVEQLVCRLDEAIDGDRMKRAWAWVAARHAVLRTRLRWRDVSPPIQEVTATLDLPFSVQHLSESGQSAEASLEQLLERDLERGIELDGLPLWRATLVVLGPAQHVLVWTFHHIILDGRSIGQVVRELLDHYDGVQQDEPAPPAFKDHCEYVAGLREQATRGFWADELKGFTSPTPLPAELHGGSPNQAPARHRELRLVVSRATVDRLRLLGEEYNFTLANAIQGAWAIALARHARSEDVVFGTTRAARHSSVPAAIDMVGCLINTLPMRVLVTEDARLVSWLSSLRQKTLAMRPHEQAELATLKELTGLPPGVPLFETLVVFERSTLNDRLRALGGAFAARRFELREQSSFPLVLAAYQAGDELVLQLEYDSGRCEPEAVARLSRHVVTLLDSFAAAPDGRIGELAMLPEDEYQRLVELGSGDGNLVPTGARSYVEAWPELVRSAPDALAVVAGDVELTFGALDATARSVAALVEPGRVVAVRLQRSSWFPVALLGVLLAGATYLPLDPGWPPDRAQLLLDDARASVLLTEEELAATAPDGPWRTIVLRQPLAAGQRDLPAVRPEDAAYLLYTSGSTGKPKGVVVPHRAMLAHARAIVPAFELSPNDRVYQFTSPGFDVSIEELLPTWLARAGVVLRSDKAGQSIDHFLAEITRHGVSVLNLPAAFFHEVAFELAASKRRLPETVRLVIAGGERANPTAYRAFRQMHPSVRFLNAYGPTETAVTCTFGDPLAAGIPADGKTELPIGRPLGTCRAYVVRSGTDLAPLGAPGELWIAGPQVASGYLNRGELTERVFVPNPFARTADEARAYRTGDLVRYTARGELEFHGRIDEQVKIRGYRIEPAEIEAVLREHAAVRDALVSVCTLGDGSRGLVGYVVPNKVAPAATPDELRDWLRARLPAYMVPSNVLLIEAIPVGPTGKVDKARLPDPPTRAAQPSTAATESDTEAWIASLFAELLGARDIGAHSHFFDLGGHSLHALRLIARLSARANAPVDMALVFANPTVRELARALENKGGANLPNVVPLNRSTRPALPLFCVLGVQLYARLARELESDRQVYGVFLPEMVEAMVHGRALELDVHALAARYIEKIRERQPHGPYLLAGSSFGGILAYEIAQQLTTQGHSVALVALFDSILPRAIKQRPIVERGLLHMLDIVADPHGYRQKMRRRVADGLRRLRPAEGGPAEPSGEQMEALRDEMFLRATEDYDRRVRKYSGDVILFRANGGIENSTEVVAPDRGWSSLLPDHAAYYDVPGSHLAILREPGVLEIAARLRQHLQEIEAPRSHRPSGLMRLALAAAQD